MDTIGLLEDSRSRNNQHTQDYELACMSNIMMELLQKYVKHDGAIGIEDLDRWPSNCLAVDFLSATTSADSIENLKQVLSTQSLLLLTFLTMYIASPHYQCAILQG